MLAEAVAKLSFQVRKHRLSYEDLCEIFKRVRANTKLIRKKRERRLPQLLTESELQALFKLIENPEHQLMMKFLLKTAIRVHELVNVKISDIDLGNHKVFISQGKGAKDRYVLFPESMKLDLMLYIGKEKEGYLFESRQAQQYSVRRVQQIVKGYGEQAGLGNRLHPHLFRHQMLTELTRAGLTDAQIQVISGHASKKSLEVYQHIGLSSVESAYQQAVKGMSV